ncbi:DUF3883 domain-containing protein [Actinomycetes bacterium NPDC127524]
MKVYLSRSERSKLLKSLSIVQQEALFSAISITYKSEFGNLLASFKGTEQWDFYRYIDHGEVISAAKCECGRPLRYEFVLKHKETQKLRSLGSTHLQEELKIPDDIAKEVKNSLHNIDYDLDEILTRVKNQWELSEYILPFLNQKEFILPMDIKILLDADLPILERQENRLRDLVKEYNKRYGKLPNELDDIKTYISQDIIPLVNSQIGFRYLLTKQPSLPFKVLTEVNFTRDYFSGDDLYSELRYNRDFFQVEWSYKSFLGSFLSRRGNFGPKMCIAKIDLFSKGYLGLLVLCGMRSIEELQEDVRKFLSKNNLPLKILNDSTPISIEKFKSYNKARKKFEKQIDFLKLHEHQIEIGKLGEAYVYDLEREKLKSTQFYQKIDNSKALDPTNGYDIYSFEEDGTPIYIEVKTTVNIDEDFYISAHELKVAERMRNKGKIYVIYRVENILAKSTDNVIIKKIYDLGQNNQVKLEPFSWKVTIN